MTKQAAARTLREFMKYNLSLLDKESRYGLIQAHFLLKLDWVLKIMYDSTSGSDSENDEFEYQDRKKVFTCTNNIKFVRIQL